MRQRMLSVDTLCVNSEHVSVLQAALVVPSRVAYSLDLRSNVLLCSLAGKCSGVIS
jgi:hypothetical protein